VRREASIGPPCALVGNAARRGSSGGAPSVATPSRRRALDSRR
jgi:hypothetical protein